MQKYETLYILQPNLSDEQIDAIVRSFEAIIPENKGTITRTERWGKRKLAYRVGRHWEGHYILCEYEGDGAIQRELERRLRIHDDVIRHLTTRVDPRMAAELERRAARDRQGDGRRDAGPGGAMSGRERGADEGRGRGPRR